MWKKVIATVLTLALVVATLNYVPNSVGASQSDAAAYNWSSVEYITESGVSEYANKYKIVKVSEGTNGSALNIQKPGWATKAGIYISFSDAVFGTITINDIETADYSVEGAGIVFHMSAFSARANDLIVRDGNGNIKAEFYVLNETVGSSETESNPESESKEPETEDSQNPGTSTIAAPTEVAAYNFYAQAKGYQFIFEEVSDAVSYNVYVDNVAGAIANISGSEEYVPASKFASFADNKLHTVYVASVDSEGNVSAKSEGAQVRMTSLTDSSADPTDISRVYVVTNSDAKITKEKKTDASLTVISANGAIKTTSYFGTIKLRGNSTALADKPAYNISFDKKQQVFTNAEKGKKWSLLANAYEKSLMRNKLGMDFGRALGNVASPEEHYCDVYIDGKYMGNFVISEPADNERSGIEYDDSDESPDILFELEMERSEEGVLYFRPEEGLGTRFVTEDLEDFIDDNSYVTMSKYTQWQTTLKNFEKALQTSSKTDEFEYMDVESFVDMYIANEYFNTADFGYSSVKFYITYDENNKPTIHAGSLWDFDLSAGNYGGAEEVRKYDIFRAQSVNPWFSRLMGNSDFSNMVKEKYEEMQPVIQNIYKDNKLGRSQINQIYDEIELSRKRNYSPVSAGGAGWSETTLDSGERYYTYSYGNVSPYNTYTYDQHVDFLRDWLQKRNEWICTQWGIDYTEYDSEYTGVTISTDIDITGYQITSTFGGVEGNMGHRVVYEAEPTINNQKATEVGLVYGLVYGDNPITEKDVVYGSTNEYVASFKATDQGKLSVVMGDSKDASYYAMTMNYGSADGNGNVKLEAFTTKYYVRAYAKLTDGSIVYSDVYSFTAYKVADYLYQNSLINTKSTYDYIYEKILKAVDSNYQAGDFNWSNTIVK